jgi:amino acid transporter
MIQERRGRFGFWSLVLLGVNCVIGSGIFLLPGKAMELAGPASLLVYLFTTLVVLAVAVCFAECSGKFQRDGAAYVYAREAFGEFIGFEVGLMSWAIRIIAWAAMAVAFVTALSSIWPAALQWPWKALLVVAILGGLGIINSLGVRPTRLLNNLVTVGKLLPLLVVGLIGLFFLHGSNFHPLFPKGFSLDAFGATSLLIFYAFTGFEALAVAAEDIENPRRNLPIAFLVVMGLCSGLYCMIQAVAVGTLGPALARSNAPVAAAAAAFLGPAGGWLVVIGSLLSIGGINVASSFTAPRTGVGLAEDGVIPRRMAELNRFGAPQWSILATVLLAIPVALSGSFVQLAAISMVSRFAQYLPTCVAVIVLRRKRPDLTSRFTIPFGPFIPIVAVIVCLWLLSKATHTQLSWGLGALVIGVLLYGAMKLVKPAALT